MPTSPPFYITTPIYYVNDRPHIGHCYTTLLADAAARFARLSGRDTFFLTGTDEHAEKVVESAQANGMTPIQWADRNAESFKEAFAFVNCSNDDFVRTTEERHTKKVREYIERLMKPRDGGPPDIAVGEYEGWYDLNQEEYVTENAAREHNFKSPVTGRDLVRRKEQNYFFNLPRYESWLLAHIEKNPHFIQPEARRNEVLGRIREGLQKVPVSRAIKEGDPRTAWGIRMPGDEKHRVYVWIDALFNYLSVVDTPERAKYWPAQVHAMAKEILWFHAVIWPCLLHALGKPIPERIYAHSFWIREGRKMSKSLGNFIDLGTIRAYCAPAPAGFGVDAWRWYMLTQGPLGATDADFAHAKFVEAYNADLANGIGNAASRVSNMIEKYFGGRSPDAGARTDSAGFDWPALASAAATGAKSRMAAFDLAGAMAEALGLSKKVDAYIHATEPFKLAKDPARAGEVGTILANSAEALRIAAILLSPALPTSMGTLLGRLGQEPPDAAGRFARPLDELCAWGGLRPGTPIVKGDPLFPRWDPAAPAPAPLSAAGSA